MPEEDVLFGVKAVLEEKGSLPLRVFGTSMMPTLWPGTIVEIESVDGSIRSGDIVLSQQHGGLRLHRAVRKSGEWFTRADAYSSLEPLTRSDILGRTRGLVVGRWQWRGAPRLAQRVLRRALLPALPLVRTLYRVSGLKRAVLPGNPLVSLSTHPNLTFSPLTPKHLPKVSTYLRRRRIVPTRAALEEWKRRLSSGEDGFILVAELEGRLVGHARADRVRPGATSVFLSELYAAQSRHHERFVNRLVQEAELEAKARGLRLETRLVLS